jgi:hypothetical protein
VSRAASRIRGQATTAAPTGSRRAFAVESLSAGTQTSTTPELETSDERRVSEGHKRRSRTKSSIQTDVTSAYTHTAWHPPLASPPRCARSVIASRTSIIGEVRYSILPCQHWRSMYERDFRWCGWRTAARNHQHHGDVWFRNSLSLPAIISADVNLWRGSARDNVRSVRDVRPVASGALHLQVADTVASRSNKVLRIRKVADARASGQGMRCCNRVLQIPLVASSTVHQSSFRHQQHVKFLSSGPR